MSLWCKFSKKKTLNTLAKISQAEKVGQIQHPEDALKSAYLVEPMV
jgi:hypothetical protein